MARPSALAYDRLIRDIYLGGRTGPLRVALPPEGGFPPFLRAGDVALLDRAGVDGVARGDLVGIKTERGDLRILRFVGRRGDRVRLLALSRVEETSAAAVLGRVTAAERGGERLRIDARCGAARLWMDALDARLGGLRRRVRLTAELASVYWQLVDEFDTGRSQTGDLLITDRCPVGCRFCIYSCVPTGHDMSIDVVRESARAFAAAGLPRVRLLGGEPFMSVPHLVRCFRAVRESYPGDRIIILTSGYFGTSPEAVAMRMDPMLAEGLRHVHLSFDSFHLERYPVACYERVLDYCRDRDLEAALVVHYSTGLAPALAQLLALRERYPFRVRVTTVSREGDAQDLREEETSVAGFEDFRDRVLSAPGVELMPEDSSCFRWTVFPSGDVHFCCKEGAQNRVGTIGRESFPGMVDRLRRAGQRNRLNVIRFATGPTGEISGNPCLTCPLEGGADGEQG